MAPTVERATTPVLLGEGPYWCPERKSLYYVDIMGNSVCRFVPSTKEEYSVQLSENVSLVLPVAGSPDKFIISKKNKVVLLTWDGKSPKAQSEELIAVADPEPEKDNRLNDGKADPRGRFWAGTMIANNEKMFTKGHGSLFCLSEDKKIVKQQTVGLSNGLGWSLDGKTMYYVDTLENTVDTFDYDLEKGLISNRKVLFDLPKSGVEGSLDGLTIDNEGKLWLAIWRGAQVLRVDPDTGKVMTSVPIPALQVTSVVFGGPNMDELYVTTAKAGLSEAEMKAKPDSGAVFKVKGLGVTGTPSIPVKF